MTKKLLFVFIVMLLITAKGFAQETDSGMISIEDIQALSQEIIQKKSTVVVKDDPLTQPVVEAISNPPQENDLSEDDEFYSQESDSQQESSSSQGKQHFEGFNLQGYTDGGEKAWDVVGDTANIQGDMIYLTEVDGNAYGDSPMNVTSRKGKINRKTGKMTLKEDVVMTTETGAQLMTETIHWERDKDLVTTDDAVVIVDEGMTATGVGITAHPELQIAQLNKNVTVEITKEAVVKDGEKMYITCDGPMEIDQKKNIAVFNINVVVWQGDRQLQSDRLELYMMPDSKEIREMISIGNVVISQGGHKSYSQRAVMDGPTKKLTLTGRPRIVLQTDSEGGLIGFGDEEDEEVDIVEDIGEDNTEDQAKAEEVNI